MLKKITRTFFLGGDDKVVNYFLIFAFRSSLEVLDINHRKKRGRASIVRVWVIIKLSNVLQ